MAEWTVPIPDELDARVRAHVQRRGDDLAAFVSRALRDQLDYEDNAEFQAQATARIKRGMADFEAGRTRPAKQALQQIADELGLKLNR